jgi:hypothetical protein
MSFDTLFLLNYCYNVRYLKKQVQYACMFYEIQVLREVIYPL